mgnify:CR=1 FL=1
MDVPRSILIQNKIEQNILHSRNIRTRYKIACLIRKISFPCRNEWSRYRAIAGRRQWNDYRRHCSAIPTAKRSSRNEVRGPPLRRRNSTVERHAADVAAEGTRTYEHIWTPWRAVTPKRLLLERPLLDEIEKDDLTVRKIRTRTCYARLAFPSFILFLRGSEQPFKTRSIHRAFVYLPTIGAEAFNRAVRQVRSTRGSKLRCNRLKTFSGTNERARWFSCVRVFVGFRRALIYEWAEFFKPWRFRRFMREKLACNFLNCGRSQGVKRMEFLTQLDAPFTVLWLNLLTLVFRRPQSDPVVDLVADVSRSSERRQRNALSLITKLWESD